MAGGIADPGDTYSRGVGLIYVFNLIVGTGALTMPLAFGQAGWLASLILISLLAFAGFVNATFVIEAMAAANAIIKYRRKERKKELEESATNSDGDGDVDLDQATERTNLLNSGTINASNTASAGLSLVAATTNSLTSPSDNFNITEVVEMGKMASMFFSKIGVNLFYIIVIIYLYGDLAIYAVVVPKSLTNITCNIPAEEGDTKTLCWKSSSTITHGDAYRMYLSAFIFIVGPFVFVNMTKTKYLQIFTSILRWLAFTLMILLAAIIITEGKGEGEPKIIGSIQSIPNFFGVCVYSFMCHHSIPSLITPVQPKKKLSLLIFGDYLLILVFYLFLCFTAIFCFKGADIQSVYTLNFFKNNHNPVLNHVVIQYFLVLFPIFTLSTNFPIIGITLRNNLRTLLTREGRPCPWYLNRFGFPLLTLVPPVVLAYVTQNVTDLVGYTGSYAGVCIQYIVPASLVYYSRRETDKFYGRRWGNKHISPFKSKWWVILIQIWAAICLIFVSADHILEFAGYGK